MQGFGAPKVQYDEGVFGGPNADFNLDVPNGGPTVSDLGLINMMDPFTDPDASSLRQQAVATLEEDSTKLNVTESVVNLDQMIGNGNSSGSEPLQIPSISIENNIQPHLQNRPNSGSHLLSLLDRRPYPLIWTWDDNLMLQGLLHHSQMTNHGGSNVTVLDQTQAQTTAPGLGVSEGPLQGGPSNYCVNAQWEESLQDLQSLLALHGHQHSQTMNPRFLPTVPEPCGAAAFINNSSANAPASGGLHGLNRLRAGPALAVGGLSSGKLPVADVNSELLSVLQFPRSGPPSLHAHALSHHTHIQALASPVSAFPSNPGFRKEGAPSFPSNIEIPPVAGLYSPNSSSIPYASSSNYFNVNSGELGLGTLVSQVNVPGILQKQQQQHVIRAPSIMDLEQARDRCAAESRRGAAAGISVGKKHASSIFDTAKRGASEGSLLLSGKPGSDPRGVNHFATERQRREYLNEKYQTLRSLVPNPSKKADRASIVADAIDYVQELKRSVYELQLLLHHKRREATFKEAAAAQRRASTMKAKDGEGEINGAFANAPSGFRTTFLPESCSKDINLDHLSHESLRTSWMHRTSPTTGTQVDVRIVHDEVLIKFVKLRCRPERQVLLQILITLYDLHLDLQNANGASIGEHDVYFLSGKMLKGSSTFASDIVTKVLDAVDGE